MTTSGTTRGAPRNWRIALIRDHASMQARYMTAYPAAEQNISNAGDLLA